MQKNLDDSWFVYVSSLYYSIFAKAGREGIVKQKRPKQEWLERWEQQIKVGKTKWGGGGQQGQIFLRETFLNYPT